MEKIMRGIEFYLYVNERGNFPFLAGGIGHIALGDILEELDTKELKALRNRVNKLIKFKEKVEQNGKAN